MQYTVDKIEIEPFLARLAKSNQAFDARHPGLKMNRQPIHTVYGGANLYQSGTAGKIAQLAQKHFDQYAPDAATMAAASKGRYKRTLSRPTDSPLATR